MTQDTWNSIPKDDQMKWDSLSDKTKLTVTTYHFNNGKEHAEANKMEAKQHDVVFDVDDEDDNSVIEAKNHEVKSPQVNDPDATRKLHEEEGIDFEQILQAQKANTRLFTGVHEFEPGEESDKCEECNGLKVNSHWFKGFADDKEEEEQEDFEIAGVLDVFERHNTNARSNASTTSTASDRNAIAVRDRNNVIAPMNRRPISDDNNTTRPTSSVVPTVPPIQEEKTMEDQLGEAEDVEEHHAQANSLFPHLFKDKGKPWRTASLQPWDF